MDLKKSVKTLIDESERCAQLGIPYISDSSW